MFRTKQLIALIVIIAAIVALIWWAFTSHRPSVNTSAIPQVLAPSEPPTPQPTIKPGAINQPKAPSTAQLPTQPKTVITIISPNSSDKWVQGQSHTIQWSKEGGVSASIYLVSAATKSIVGWINSETNPHQTSFTWDGNSIAISRYNDQKKNLETGTYVIKIKFDSKYLPEISSDPFAIIYPSQAQPGIYQVNIKNYLFSPSSLTVNKGDKIVFTNNDSVTQRVLLLSFSPFVVQSGASLTFDTSIIGPGPYNFYSDVYPSLNLNVTVK